MNSLNKMMLVSSLIVFAYWCKELEASKQVVMTCGSDEGGEKGSHGAPGKRGPIGPRGSDGQKGNHGAKGEKGDCRKDFLATTERISRIELQLQDLGQCLSNCHNGNCIRKNNSFLCACNSGYIGRYCRKITCEDQPCGNHSSCTGPNQCTCDEGYQYLPSRDGCFGVYSSCDQVFESGLTTNGIYHITMQGRNETVPVYCELNSEGENWLVIQKRFSGSVDFYRNWTEYERGFGQLDGEFWLGLDLIHIFTSLGYNKLRVDLVDWDDDTAYAIYSSFSVGNSQSNYRLTVNGYNGSAGDGMNHNNNHQFSTKDRENDEHSSRDCAEYQHSGWWHGSCTNANLNGLYYDGMESNQYANFWWFFKTLKSLKETKMKIKIN